MSRQSEAQLENELIDQLIGLSYEQVRIRDSAALIANLRSEIDLFNDVELDDSEFAMLLTQLEKGFVFDKAERLRQRIHISRADGTSLYLRLYDSEDWMRNRYQVTSQITQKGKYENRYDVTLLINGLPLVQIELKRRDMEIKEAFNQINRYQHQTFWSNHGLFQYVQLFVISNGGDTKYLANNKLQSVKQTFFWSDRDGRRCAELEDFANAFLQPRHLGKMIARYIVRNQTNRLLMALRPYQYHAVEAIVHQVMTSRDDGYIWHTTGSGKTLTSFKASQIIMQLPDVDKVIFVVDRRDLDEQTSREFNAFKKGSVDTHANTKSLVKQLNSDTKLVLTTIQKLNNAITKSSYEKKISALSDKRIVFIFDECHRSQFGDTHDRLTKYFTDAQLFGFTGTPIFADNASKNDYGKRTTRDLFGECLHKYVITDAINDKNVLRFAIEYIGRYRNLHKNAFIDIQVEDIDRQEVWDDQDRLETIARYITLIHDQKTHNRAFSAIFAVSSIDHLVRYYDLINKIITEEELDLRIAAVFTYSPNPDDPYADDSLPDSYTPDQTVSMAAEPTLVHKATHHRDDLERIIQDYNKQYGTAYDAKDAKKLDQYYKAVGKRLKNREKPSFDIPKNRLDIVLVVNMMLTGFDAKMVNTLYVDKNLKQHGLIQAFSRTNRIKGERKSQGNILCFRNLKKATDEAVKLFANKDAVEVITMPAYGDLLEKMEGAIAALREITPTYKDVDQLFGEEQKALFVQAFRRVLRLFNVMKTYSEFDWEDIQITEEELQNFTGKYRNLKDEVEEDRAKDKVSILNDIDFEMELVHRDKINVVYIIKLLAQLSNSTGSEAVAQRNFINKLLNNEPSLQSKKILIEKFINDYLPQIDDHEDIDDVFMEYMQEQRIIALKQICDEESLDHDQFSALMDAYIFSGQDPVRKDILKCLDSRPSIMKAREIGERIIAKMRQFVETFVDGMVA